MLIEIDCIAYLEAEKTERGTARKSKKKASRRK
jgi:hypothetical protein